MKILKSFQYMRFSKYRRFCFGGLFHNFRSGFQTSKKTYVFETYVFRRFFFVKIGWYSKLFDSETQRYITMVYLYYSHLLLQWSVKKKKKFTEKWWWYDDEEEEEDEWTTNPECLFTKTFYNYLCIHTSIFDSKQTHVIHEPCHFRFLSFNPTS